MSRAATARLFVAVDPPPAACRQLAAWARDATRSVGIGTRRRHDLSVRLLDEQALHLTLCFLGSRPAAEIDTIAAAVEGCEGSIEELLVGAPLWLPPRRPRALAVAVHDRAGSLVRLQDAVSRALAGAIAWEPQRRHFKAHVTLARVGGRAQSGRRSSWVQDQLPATPALRFTPAAVILYRSRLSPTGASYEALAASTLTPMESKSSDSEESPPPSDTGAQTSDVPSLETIGEEPSSHSGSDSSSQR